jgi:hypothetical protein
MQSHVRARALRTECESDADADACHAAEDLFRVAADTWRALVDGRPGDDAHPEWHFMLAQASFHAGRFEAAASAAERYLETGAEEWRVQSARTLVEAREQVIARDIVAIRQEPPDPAGQPLAVVPLGIPDEVQRLFDARARYVEVVAAADDPERLARRYALDNALLLHLYGHWERATPALRAAFESGCRGEAGWEGGKAAFRARRAEALALGRYDAVRSIGEELSSTATSGAPRAASRAPARATTPFAWRGSTECPATSSAADASCSGRSMHVVANSVSGRSGPATRSSKRWTDASSNPPSASPR